MADKKLNKRQIDLELDPGEFKKIGYALIDQLAEYYEKIGNQQVTSGKAPSEIRDQLGDSNLPENGRPPSEIISEAFTLLKDHNMHIGHPKFWAFICGSGLPINALADMMASIMNSNLGGYVISPMATEIEKQTISWLADFINCPDHSEGILVSGGNMANMVAFWAARKAKATYDIQKEGTQQKMISYVSGETHTWIQKAADLAGLGTDSIRWIKPDSEGKMPLDTLEAQINSDINKGHIPYLIVANAGSVSTGVVDPIRDLHQLSQKYDLWLHADGAYGGVAASLPNCEEDLRAIRLCDSIAIDPHKWLYCSVEVGCTLVKDQKVLQDAFSYKPPYYKYEEHEADRPTNFYELGPQNSRGFRALKVWMALQQAGRQGYISNIQFDIDLTYRFFKLLDDYPQLEAHTCHLSICTFRYIPELYRDAKEENREAINRFNEELLLLIQQQGKTFISNAVLKDTFYLRICIVNHRTVWDHIASLPEIVIEAAESIST